MHIADLDEIKGALAGLDLLPAIEAGFVAYSEGRANVPPVAENRSTAARVIGAALRSAPSRRRTPRARRRYG